MLQLRWATVMIMLASPCTVSASARITHVLHIGDNAGRDTHLPQVSVRGIATNPPRFLSVARGV